MFVLVLLYTTLEPPEEYLFLNRRGAENTERGVNYYRESQYSISLICSGRLCVPLRYLGVPLR